VEKLVNISQNHFFMLIVIGFLLYHPLHMSKCKKICRQNLENIFFFSSIQDLVKFYKNHLFTPGRKISKPSVGQNGSILYFVGQTACHVLKLCEKIKEISLNCIWQAVKKRQFILVCCVFFGGYCINN